MSYGLMISNNDCRNNFSFSNQGACLIFPRLSGLSPFMGDTDLETMANVTIAEYDYEDEAFDKVSDLAKDFIDKLLIKEKE